MQKKSSPRVTGAMADVVFTTAAKPKPSTLKTLLVAVLIGVGCLALGLYVSVRWAEKQILTTDNWVALVAPLPKEPVVSEALSRYISDRVFAAVPVEQKIADALPPEAGFLAGPLASQLQTITTNTAQKVVTGDRFQTLWAGANRIAVNSLIARARGETPPLQQRINEKFDINLSDVRGQLRDALGNAAQAIPALQPVADEAIDVSVDLQARPRRLQQAVRTIDYAAIVLPLLTAAALLGALAFSGHRRHTVIVIATTVIVVMLLELIAIKVFRQRTLDQVRIASNIPAVAFIYDTVVAWLRHMIFWVLGISALIFVLCGVFGNASWARTVRSTLRAERITGSRYGRGWQMARLAMRRWQPYLYAGLAMIVLVYVALFMSVTARSMTNAVLAGLSLAAIVRIIATPPYHAVSRIVGRQ